MLLGVVSDTHGHVPFTQEAVRILESMDVDAVLHCGDIGSTEIPRLFRPWPTHFVFGNVDGNEKALRAAIEAEQLHCHGRFGDLELGQTRIALLHSDDVRRFREVIESGDYGLVCYGHTHHAEHHLHDDTLVLNPGALYRAQPHSLAVVELPGRVVHHITVN